MIVREILADVAKIAEGEALCQSIDKSEDETDDQVKSKVDALLSCYNTVIRDVALNYHEHLKTVEVLEESVCISSLHDYIMKVVSITDSFGNDLKYKQTGDCIKAKRCPFYLTYRTVPNGQRLDETFIYEKTEIGENMIIYGVLSEYCLKQNRIEEALNWESKYRQAVDFRRDYKSRKMKAGKTWGL